MKALKKHSTDRFVTEINALVENNDVSVMDAIVHYCDKYGLEIETVASIVKSNSKIKAKLQAEAEELNYLPKTSKLPI